MQIEVHERIDENHDMLQKFVQFVKMCALYNANYWRWIQLHQKVWKYALTQIKWVMTITQLPHEFLPRSWSRTPLCSHRCQEDRTNLPVSGSSHAHARGISRDRLKISFKRYSLILLLIYVRCVDPTELGSYMSSVACPACPKGGFLLPGHIQVEKER